MFQKIVVSVVCAVLLLGAATVALAQTETVFDFSTCTTGEEQPLLLGGAKPASQILRDVELLSQPPLGDYSQPMLIANIPQGIWVIVFDLDEQTRSYFRILVPCGSFAITGWIEAEAVNFSIRRADIYNAPPGCAVAIDTIDSLDDLWESSVDGTVAVAFDVFRETSGTRYPDSFFYPTRNGRELRDKERRIATSGAFLLNGSVISTDLQPGQMLGFSVISTSDETLHMFGIMYQVPEGCEFAER